MEVLKIVKQDYIYGQRNGTYADLPIGRFGSGKNHGCGPFAVYNALLALGANSATPTEIIRRIGENNGIAFGGLFGTRPKALAACLKELGYAASFSYIVMNRTRKCGIDRLVKESDASILLYIWRRRFKIGLHYVMIKHTEDGFLVYNQYGNDTEVRVYQSLKGLFAVLGIIKIECLSF